MLIGYRGFAKFTQGQGRARAHAPEAVQQRDASGALCLAGAEALGPDGLDQDAPARTIVARGFVGRRSTCGRSPAPSPAAPARSSATSSPSASSAFLR